MWEEHSKNFFSNFLNRAHNDFSVHQSTQPLSVVRRYIMFGGICKQRFPCHIHELWMMNIIILHLFCVFLPCARCHAKLRFYFLYLFPLYCTDFFYSISCSSIWVFVNYGLLSYFRLACPAVPMCPNPCPIYQQWWLRRWHSWDPFQTSWMPSLGDRLSRRSNRLRLVWLIGWFCDFGFTNQSFI